jgi:hypothetical protein
MSYEQWVPLFGKAADDPAVAEALKAAGITTKIKIGKDELRASENVPGTGMMITFTDESVLNPSQGVIGRPILTAVMMVVQSNQGDTLYTGPLPQKLEKQTSRDALRARLGNPLRSSDGPVFWDAWQIDGVEVQPTYKRDRQSIARVVVRRPESR